MDTMNPNQMPPMQTGMETTSSKGPLIAVIIILALIIIGGLYFLKERNSQMAEIPVVPQRDSMVESLKMQGTSDDVNSIEADLNSTNIDDLDQGAAVIESQL